MFSNCFYMRCKSSTCFNQVVLVHFGYFSDCDSFQRIIGVLGMFIAHSFNTGRHLIFKLANRPFSLGEIESDFYFSTIYICVHLVSFFSTSALLFWEVVFTLFLFPSWLSFLTLASRFPLHSLQRFSQDVSLFSLPLLQMLFSFPRSGRVSAFFLRSIYASDLEKPLLIRITIIILFREMPSAISQASKNNPNTVGVQFPVIFHFVYDCSGVFS